MNLLFTKDQYLTLRILPAAGTHLRRMDRNVFNLDDSSGFFSEMAAELIFLEFSLNSTPQYSIKTAPQSNPSPLSSYRCAFQQRVSNESQPRVTHNEKPGATYRQINCPEQEEGTQHSENAGKLCVTAPRGSSGDRPS